MLWQVSCHVYDSASRDGDWGSGVNKHMLLTLTLPPHSIMSESLPNQSVSAYVSVCTCTWVCVCARLRVRFHVCRLMCECVCRRKWEKERERRKERGFVSLFWSQPDGLWPGLVAGRLPCAVLMSARAPVCRTQEDRARCQSTGNQPIMRKWSSLQPS